MVHLNPRDGFSTLFTGRLLHAQLWMAEGVHVCVRVHVHVCACRYTCVHAGTRDELLELPF